MEFLSIDPRLIFIVDRLACRSMWYILGELVESHENAIEITKFLVDDSYRPKKNS